MQSRCDGYGVHFRSSMYASPNQTLAEADVGFSVLTSGPRVLEGLVVIQSGPRLGLVRSGLRTLGLWPRDSKEEVIGFRVPLDLLPSKGDRTRTYLGWRAGGSLPLASASGVCRLEQSWYRPTRGRAREAGPVCGREGAGQEEEGEEEGEGSAVLRAFESLLVFWVACGSRLRGGMGCTGMGKAGEG
ncbi:hypothetical protein IE53DRAFT_154446 [Violaceomyces palustris]|uniref:Uncharacterized protein n=1 Tax=Violaceomyces palustris TaxID=1673888 RepID=A0ACD0NU07_9BASI|nr:hypothetical protein IE53DRAFT_154446 [Violaceomyces palustris]